MTTYLGKSCSFCLPRVPFVNCRQFMYLVISLLVLRAGYGIWLYQFLIIAYLFTFQALSDEVQDKKSKLDALQNFFGVENNQLLVRKYELIGEDFESSRVARIHTERGHIGTSFLFRKYPLVSDDINNYEFIDVFTLKEYFFHLFEEPVDDVTWFRNKQPGTCTIHFDFIIVPTSFSFELHTRDEIIHLCEHNPKHNINLEKGENCLLVHKNMPDFIRAGLKIYVYYNI